MPAPYELTATEAVERLRRRELSPVELVTSLLERIDALEPDIQAWETVDREGALAAARRCEDVLAQGTGGMLCGLPVGIKDIFLTAGLPTTADFAPYRDRDLAPQQDATAVARLRAAGAIILGKTVTTQFAFSDPARTRNPWNPNHTPGGSSAGSGAAVAARMVPAALGTQTAGSTLRPAAYCGVVGLKPSYGRISRWGVLPLSWSLDHVGIIVRTVADAALLLQALAGYDARDTGSARRQVPDYLAALAAEGPAPRLGLVRDFMDAAAPESRAHVATVAARLEASGAAIREIRLPLPLPDVLAVQQAIMQVEAAAVHAHLLTQHPESYRPKLRAYAEVGQLIPGPVYVHAQRLRRRIREGVLKGLRGLDGLIMPTISDAAPDPSTTGDRTFQAVWTLLGLPAISLPTGLSAAGLPLATQLVARPFQEATLLGAAHWCAAALGTLPPPR
ncbi:MAG: amidase [Chloroflexi bacterium]|nr:amidase [Chloroflexota bacterium]